MAKRKVRRARRSFTPEFKADAVRLCQAPHALQQTWPGRSGRLLFGDHSAPVKNMVQGLPRTWHW